MTISDDDDMASAASSGVSIPAIASGTAKRLYTSAMPKFCRTSRPERRATSTVSTIGRSSRPWNTTSAVVWLTSTAVEGDIDTAAAASAGASFSPSPTIRTVRP